MLLRNHVEPIWNSQEVQEADSGFIEQSDDDLERAQEVHKAFFPTQKLSIPGLSARASISRSMQRWALL